MGRKPVGPDKSQITHQNRLMVVRFTGGPAAAAGVPGDGALLARSGCGC
jgi:hypothetical protein